jgi:hypothetical protein
MGPDTTLPLVSPRTVWSGPWEKVNSFAFRVTDCGLLNSKMKAAAGMMHSKKGGIHQ